MRLAPAFALAGALALPWPPAAAAVARRTHAHTRSRARKPPQPAVARALSGLLSSGAISPSAYDGYHAVYTRAAGSLRRLSGVRRDELAAVIANLEAMARGGQLTAARLPLAFMTLRRNQEWWTERPAPADGQRVSMAGSRLVWERYAGQGIEIQWLGTFAEANGYWSSGDTAALEQVLDEAIALASPRAGGIAWEYMFRFDGGAPPWTSALSQGTALQALARAWSATHEQRFSSAAQQALGVFRTAPPEGVAAQAGGSRELAGAGAWYVQYTYAPSDHVINGFIQALVGLYDYSRLTGDSVGQRLFEAGDAQARAQLPSFDTGAWSRYDQRSESSLSYHELLSEFLEHLCERTRAGEPLEAGSAQGAGGQAPGAQIAGDDVYCTTAARFRQDLKTPPTLALLTSAVNARERAGVQVKLSKISTVSMTIALGRRTVWSSRATVEGGAPRLLWVTPSKPGVYAVVLRATDLAGNQASASGSIRVKPASRRARERHRRGHGPKHGAAKHGAGGGSPAGGAPPGGRAATSSAPGRISPAARTLPAL